MLYQHRLRTLTHQSAAVGWQPGKVVCVGRNYAEHARELNNPVPAEPLLFLKPTSAMVSMASPIRIPQGHGECHIETEMSLLIGLPVHAQSSSSELLASIAGVGIGFDLTLRDLQNQLKKAGHPWEKAKAFDGACPLSDFILPERTDLADVSIELQRNGQLQQQGNTSQMLTPVERLLTYIVQFFSLLPGDVVMTGTPAGVGPLQSGDRLTAKLGNDLVVSTSVA